MKEQLAIGIILDSVKRAGDMFLTDFRQNKIPSGKEQLSAQLDDVDSRCKTFLEASLRTDFPEIPFYLGDEFDSQGQIRPMALPAYWLCDAMDGAIQYLQHMPGWTINLVLVQNGKVTMAVIYDPLSGELFHAQAGLGAYLNGKPIRPAHKTDTDAMVAVLEYGHETIPEADRNKKHGEALTALLNHFGVVRNYGPHGLQLAYTAAGRIDLFYQLGLDTFNWLAGILIAEEAGAEVLNQSGEKWKWGDESLVVSAPGIADSFIKSMMSGSGNYPIQP